MEEKKIKVKILPLHNIGGVGHEGDEVWMSKAEAETYIAAGYVEVVKDEAPPPTPPHLEEHKMERGEAPVEDHKVMKPQSKRVKK
jgi:hypothetical protein